MIGDEIGTSGGFCAKFGLNFVVFVANLRGILWFLRDFL